MTTDPSRKTTASTTKNRTSEPASSREAEALATDRRANDDPLRVNLVSLGCPKNLVDSEVILGNLGADGHAITASPEDADVIVVNTCGFIDRAKEESIDAILEACGRKEASGGPKVVVTGCLGQRYPDDIRRDLPEVDAIIGLGQYSDIGSTLRDLCRSPTSTNGAAAPERAEPFVRVRPQDEPCSEEVGRFRLTPRHYAYVKISEGCDNPCTFCSIPAIRGGFRSKPIPALEREVRELVSTGVKEIVLVAQDTTSYGADLDGRYALAELLERLAGIEGVEWIRILYAYPAFLTNEMIDAIARIDKVVKYLDMPLQHIAERTLRHMGRRFTELKTRRLLDRLRERVPGIFLRTTFIVGFPGEDEREFVTLRDFVRDFGFERVGVFTYSEEEGTPSAEFSDSVPEDVRESRREELMLVQQENAFRQNAGRVGESVRVIVDGVDPDRSAEGRCVLSSRSAGEAPEIDPIIAIEPPVSREDGPPPGLDGILGIPSWEAKRPEDSIGRFATVEIVGTDGYDLIAVERQRPPDALTPRRRAN